jgi:hypothetical protein
MLGNPLRAASCLMSPQFGDDHPAQISLSDLQLANNARSIQPRSKNSIMRHFNKNSAWVDFLIFFVFKVEDILYQLHLGYGWIYDACKHS